MLSPNRVLLWVPGVISGSAQPVGSPSHWAKGRASSSAVGGGGQATPALKSAFSCSPNAWSSPEPLPCCLEASLGLAVGPGLGPTCGLTSCPVPFPSPSLGRCPMPGAWATPSASQLSCHLLQWWDSRDCQTLSCQPPWGCPSTVLAPR